ncbi:MULTISPECIES: LysR substrate-binding domain-containing protein [Pseudomonadaceae]|uniref:LysR family transcriptional regulator n=1 Tax=Pseudomonas denitrificans TaxID=43306 RepID=A0A9X7MY30_PSEDE|nr:MULTISPECIES: LysR substrate-binding domain-containing protein [Pseudomonadaceae]MBD9516868.1 LysR family transcriptional regulator [Pseudomonas sp. PDM22]MBD9629295.1 LysR family transcriptional regulator [Pseudomonas sp. PDM19]OQR27437.1 transcriptional regulator [Pseudomonas sp. T]QEY71444.1 LysR family transcriptional regulator [Pseudomonas denitrificans (nom. rej.)]
MSRINVRNISRIDLNLLLTFHCLMTERSATRASAVLHVTQGAVSAALRRLREHFADELFIRTASGMQPTRKAMELAPKIAEALTSISGVLGSEPEFSAHESSYVFNIGLSDDIEACLAPRIVNAAAAEGLGVSFAFHQSNSSLWKQSLQDPDMDLVICSEPKDFGTSYSSQVLFSSSYSCLYRPRGRAADLPIGLEEYFAANHVRVSYDGRRGFIDDMFEAAGYARRVTASFTHFSGALTTLMSSEVIATIPTFAAESYAAMTDLTVSPVPFPVPSFRCFMLWDIARHNKPHHDWLRQFIGELGQKLG